MDTMWHNKYLGKPWAAVPCPPETYTCGELMRHVYKQELGIDAVAIMVPDARILRDCIRAFSPEIFGLRPLAPNENPKEYDVVFLGRAADFDHVGMACTTADGLLVLHCMQKYGVQLDSMADLCGVYCFRFAKWYRHKEMGG